MNNEEIEGLCTNIYELHSQLCWHYNNLTEPESSDALKVDTGRRSVSDLLKTSLSAFVSSGQLLEEMEKRKEGPKDG